MLLATAAARFLTQLEADGRSPLTARVYRSELERFIRWAGAKNHVEAIRPDAIAAYLTAPASRVSPDGTDRSTRTVNRTRTVLRLFFSYLADRGTIRQSPARLLRNGRTDRPIPTVLSKTEEKRLLAALDAGATTPVGRRDRVLFTLLLRSGMRLTAALALDVEDLDLAQGTALSRSGKNGRIQEIYLPKVVVRLLKRHLKDRGRGTSRAVFASSRERRLSARQAQYRFGALLAAASIERPVTVHALRHTFATRLREKTGDLRIVQAALGHRQLGTTEVYGTVSAMEIQQAVVG
jgi:site-specific recombinase XerD